MIIFILNQIDEKYTPLGDGEPIIEMKDGKSEIVVENGEVKVTKSNIFSEKNTPLTSEAVNSEGFNNDYQDYKEVLNNHFKKRQNKMTGDGAYKDKIDRFSNTEAKGFKSLVNKALKK